MDTKQRNELTNILLAMFLAVAIVGYLASFSFPHNTVMLVTGISEAIIAVLLAYLVMFAKATDEDAAAESNEQ